MTIVLRKSIPIALLLALVVLVGCGTSVSTQKIPTTIAEVPRITPQEMKEKLDAGEDLVIVDTRSLESFNHSHIAGAVSLPLDEIGTRHGELPKDTLLVLYCT